jgi:hypothetical protein
MPTTTTTTTFQCQQCKRKYKQATNYERHVAICSLVNSKSIQEVTANAQLFSDHEDVASQTPSMAQLFVVVQHLAKTVQQLQSKVAHLEQLAYIRKPKPDVRAELMSRPAVPDTPFCKWVMQRVAGRITRDTLVECVFRTSNLVDAMCKLVMKEVAGGGGGSGGGGGGGGGGGAAPIYADETKSGTFLTYDVAQFTTAVTLSTTCDGAGASDTGLGPDGGALGTEWRPMPTDAFRWMVNAVHRQILSEYHSWTVDCNDNSDEFIDTSMRYGSVVLGGNMEWSAVVTRFGTKLWTAMCEKQRDH